MKKYRSINYYFSPNQEHPRLDVMIKESLVLKAWPAVSLCNTSLSSAHAQLQQLSLPLAVTSPPPSLQLSAVSLSLAKFCSQLAVN